MLWHAPPASAIAQQVPKQTSSLTKPFTPQHIGLSKHAPDNNKSQQSLFDACNEATICCPLLCHLSPPDARQGQYGYLYPMVSLWRQAGSCHHFHAFCCLQSTIPCESHTACVGMQGQHLELILECCLAHPIIPSHRPC